MDLSVEVPMVVAANPVMDLGQCVICMSDEQESGSQGETHRTSLASLFACQATMAQGIQPPYSETIYCDDLVVEHKGECAEGFVERLIAEATSDRELSIRAILAQCSLAARLGYTSVLILVGTTDTNFFDHQLDQVTFGIIPSTHNATHAVQIAAEQ